MSARTLQGILGLGSYRSAWRMLHTLRDAARVVARVKLRGYVEVGFYRFSPAQQGNIIMVVEGDDRSLIAVRMRLLRDDSPDEIVSYIQSAVETGSVVHTDDSARFATLKDLGYIHVPTSVGALKGDEVRRRFPWVQLMASQIRRWLDGTYNGRYEPFYIDRYLAEFAFRFNKSRASTDPFEALLRALAEERRVREVERSA